MILTSTRQPRCDGVYLVQLRYPYHHVPAFAEWRDGQWLNADGQPTQMVQAWSDENRLDEPAAETPRKAA